MKKKIYAVLCMVIMMASFILTACQKTEAKAETQTYAWPLGTSSPEDKVTQIFAEKFVEEVERLSDGKMKIDIYPNSTIGNDTELLESCADGDIPFVVQNTAPQVSFMPDMAVFDLPCAFSTIEEAREAVDNVEFYNEIQAVYESADYHLLGIADQGFRVMTSNTKVTKLSDFKGQKIRTMENSNHLAFWKALSANPTPMAFSEVYIGLQQNTIDAQENPYEVIVSGKMYEQQDYVIETNHLPHYICLFMSQEFFNRLPEDEQVICTEAAKTATEYAREQSDSRIQDRIDIMEASGTELVAVSEELHEEMLQQSQGIYESIREAVGDELVDAYTQDGSK